MPVVAEAVSVFRQQVIRAWENGEERLAASELPGESSYSGYLMLGFRNLNFHLHALVPSRLGMEVQQSLANGLSHKSARFGFAMKLHLAFLPGEY